MSWFKIEAYPRNLAPAGPSSRILDAMASPSIMGGGWISLSFLRYRQVILIGMGAFRGGMITRTPECRQPRIAPPRASTMKLTKNLEIFQHLIITQLSLNVLSLLELKQAGILHL